MNFDSLFLTKEFFGILIEKVHSFIFAKNFILFTVRKDPEPVLDTGTHLGQNPQY